MTQETPIGFELFKKLEAVLKSAPDETTSEDVLRALAFTSAKVLVAAGKANERDVDALGEWFVGTLQDCCEQRLAKIKERA